MAKQNWMGKTCASMASAVNGVKNSAGNTVRDGQITDARREVDRLTREIGNLTVHKLDAGMKATDDIHERYVAILAAREKMRTAEQAKTVRWAVCPHCGEKTIAGMRFCGVCGKALGSQA